ncbi:hypothetical protein [Salmonella sp. s54925]|uniref:hypothetical protein n=1 Tax=Salmonella sp. s54925 TaxID=3159674 RepID=UPI0039812DC7
MDHLEILVSLEMLATRVNKEIKEVAAKLAPTDDRDQAVKMVSLGTLARRETAVQMVNKGYLDQLETKDNRERKEEVGRMARTVKMENPVRLVLMVPLVIKVKRVYRVFLETPDLVEKRVQSVNLVQKV